MNAQATIEDDFDALVEAEERSQVRHEYIGGQFYAMSGGTPIHADLGHRLQVAVGSRLRGKRCYGSSGDQRVRTSEDATNWYYPDFLIKCPPNRFHPRDKNALLNPRAIFEVLSPATEQFDRTGKFDEYQLIEELSDYILVSAETVRVDHFRRLENGGWEFHSYTRLDQELRLDNFEISVPMSEIYEDIEIDAVRVLPQIATLDEAEAMT